MVGSVVRNAPGMSSGCRPVSEVAVAGVTIYSKRWCVYCVAARRLLSSLGLEYEEISLDGRKELRRELSAANGGWPTVPMIFVGETFIGGYDDLQLDCSGVGDADSAGLALLLEWKSEARRQNGTIRFSGLPKSIVAIARTTEVDQLLD